MDPTITRFDTLLAALPRGGFVNNSTGFGSATDKTQAAYYQAGRALDPYTLSAMYHGSDLSARVVGALPEEEFRPGFDLEFESATDEKPKTDEALSKAINKRLQELGAWPLLLEGRVWGRLFGGAATVLGADDGLGAAEPLQVDRVKRVDWLLSVDRRELVPNRVYQTGPKAGRPETYWIVPADQTAAPGGVPQGSFELHETRLILWPGVRTARRERVSNGGWDWSVLDSLWPVIQTFEATWKGAELLVVEASQGVFTLPQLAKMMLAGKGEVLAERMRQVDRSKSTMNSILLGENETYERLAAQFSGLADVLDQAKLRLSAGVRIPVVILFGQQVGGLGQEGSTDLRWFFNQTAVSQVEIVQPRLVQLINLVLAELGRTDVRPCVKWRSLWEPTDQELAAGEKAQMETDVGYVRDSILTAEEVVISRFANGRMTKGYSAVDVEARRKSLKAAIDELSDPPAAPEPPKGLYPDMGGGTPTDEPEDDEDDTTEDA